MLLTGFNNWRTRQANKRIFLSCLWREKQISKSKLAQITGLSIPAVSNILEELLSEGLVSHSQKKMSSRGLNRGSWQLPTDADWTLCMNISPMGIEYQLANYDLTPLGDYGNHIEHFSTPQALLAAVEACWRQVCKIWATKKINLALAVHGQVDPITGVSQNMPQAPWKTAIELKYILEEKHGIRVLVDNDCVMLALAEKWQGALQQRDFCVINVDYGIGSSFVIKNDIYRGSLYGSGQIGHTIIDPDGLLCECGRYGCLETVASLNALKKQARVWLKNKLNNHINPNKVSTEQLIHAYQNGDIHLQAWVENSANIIGLSIYNLLNILNINQIFLYGRCCEFGNNWLQIIRQQTSITPFDQGHNLQSSATSIGFGQLNRTQQLLGIGYLYVEEQLKTLL